MSDTNVTQQEQEQDQQQQQQDKQQVLKTIDAVSEKFGKQLLQLGISRKPGS